MRRTHAVAVAIGAVLLLRGGTGELVAAPRQPPSSFAPKVQSRPVRVSHVHHRTHECSPTREAGCAPGLTDMDSYTALSFVPLSLAASTVRPPQVVEVAFERHVGRQERVVELAPGRWDIDWPGHRTLRRLNITAQSAPTIALTTTTGRCERDGKGCRLIGDAVSRRIVVSER